MNLRLLAVLVTVAAASANIEYHGGLKVQGPLPCPYSGKYIPPGPGYNQVAPTWPGKYPGVQSYPNVPAQNEVEVNNGLTRCSCGCFHPPESYVGPQLLEPPLTPGGPPSRYVYPPPPPPRVLSPPPPQAPDQPTNTSPIMKIPRKSESSSITINFNPPETKSPNSIYSPFSPPTTALSLPPRRSFLYTQPPPLVASCPAAVFYPATIPYSVYPPFTCPARPPTVPSSQPFATTPIPTTPFTARGDGKTIASFTSTIPDTKIYNVTTDGSVKRDPLLTFKLLSAAVAKSGVPSPPSPPPPPSLEAQAGKADCSMPFPPQLV